MNKIFVLLAVALVGIPIYSKAETWLWKMGSHEYSMDDFTRDYKSYIKLMALQMGTTTDTLAEYVKKTDEINDARTKAIVEQLRPESFGENFMTLSLLKSHALENKYFEKTETIQLQKFLSDYIISQLYLSEIIAKLPVEIKDEDVEKAWVIEREKSESYKSIPIEQGLAFTRQKLTLEKREMLRKEFLKSLLEKYKIEKNSEYKNMMNAVNLR